MPPVSRLAVPVTLALPALLLLGAACSGRTTTALPGDGHDAAVIGEVASARDGGDASTLDSGSQASVADAAGPWNEDAAQPDAGCGPLALVLDPDATPGTCEISPADVACDSPADCALLMMGHCSCITMVVGVNKTSTASCPMPPCPPPIGGPCVGPGYETQDCTQELYGEIGVTCVGHRCQTFAAIEH